MDTWTLIRFLHLIALAFFVGGQLMLVAAVVPTVRRSGGNEALMRSVARRYGMGSLVAIVVLLATGAAMAEHFGRWGNSVLQVKLMLFVLVGVLIALHIATPNSRAVSVGVFVVSVVIVWLGVELAH